MLKKCSKCSVEKPLEDFPIRKDRKIGYGAACKECNRERFRKYRQTHKIELIKRRREYYQTHKMELVRKRRKYRQTHKIEIAKKDRKYKSSDKGKLAAKRAKHNRRTRSKATISNLTVKQWDTLLRMQGNRCNMCNRKFTKKKPPTMDHIIPISSNGNLTSDNVQALCLSCNSSKNAKLDLHFIQTWGL